MHTQPFNGPLSGTTQVCRYQKGKTNLDFTQAGDSEWQWHQLGHVQACTLLQTDNHASTPPLSFLQARCPSLRHRIKIHLILKEKLITIYLSRIGPKKWKICIQSTNEDFTLPQNVTVPSFGVFS